MNLAAGTRLGPYAIERAIGAGGMGVVYRADDKRLGRKVAIKLLPLAKGEYFRRFEREARTIGNLNHPNLLTLFDVGEHDGTPYMVTEMLEGESLRERLVRGPLGLREAIRVAAEVARGLAAAHDAGVIHRDVKPDNIYLTSEGRTKILDFGIAKLRRSTVEMKAVDGSEPTATPTTAETGLIIGTPGYMAPEQLEGDKVDARTDIFALGVVLYEMICGKRAFAAESNVEESYAILRTTPDPPKGATKGLARVVLRCLEKKPDARFQSATDLAFALDELDASTDPISRISKISIEPAAMAPTVRDQRPSALPLRRRWWLALVGAAAVVAGTAGVLVGRALAPSAVPAPPVAAPPAPAAAWPSFVEGGPAYRRVTFHGELYTSARLAPDGASILYAAKRDGKDQILRTQLANPSILPVRAPGRLLDVSAKGELAVLAEDAGGTLSRVLEGAGARAVADHVTDATWLPDDTLAIVRDGRALESPIGTPIVTRTTGKLTLLRASPDGRWFAFADQPAINDSLGKVVIVDRKGVQIAATGEQSGIEGVAWSPDGTEVWFSNGQTLYALDRHGRTRVVLRGAIRTTIMDVRAGKALIAASDLRLKLFTGPRAGGAYREAGWFDSSEIEGVSRDGSTLAFVEAAGTALDATGYAHFVRRGGEPAAHLTNAYGAALLPDASALIAVASPTALTKVPTGVGAPTAIPIAPIANLEIGDRPVVSWSGRYVVVRGAAAGKPPQLWRIDLEQPSVLAIPTDTGGRHPISPDGSTVAIANAAGGITLVDIAGTKQPRSLAGSVGEEPIGFHANGRAVFTMRLAGSAIQVDQLDLASGARTAWATLSPDQRPVYFSVLLSGDGEVVTYSTNADASDLYVLEPPTK
jgi:Tol biopolymer transport system component